MAGGGWLVGGGVRDAWSTTTGWPGMMSGGTAMMGGFAAQQAPGPGEAGFAAGTQPSPRVVRVFAGPGYSFTPSEITVARGETVTFQVTSMGGLVHEFMVGPADAVTADQAGTPEATDIGMMQTKSVTYTFNGAGPYAFACHAPGHYEAGMRGTVTVVD
jgi:plastocyanin